MKTKRRRMPRATLVALFALTAGLFTALPGYFAPQGYVASAGCTKSGRASFDPDGTPRCDCSGNSNGGNCACIVPCPPGGGEFEILEGAY